MKDQLACGQGKTCEKVFICFGNCHMAAKSKRVFGMVPFHSAMNSHFSTWAQYLEPIIPYQGLEVDIFYSEPVNGP